MDGTLFLLGKVEIDRSDRRRTAGEAEVGDEWRPDRLETRRTGGIAW
jgi:hypothetical protein